MIIQRIATAIRHQNWSQIITEILIVVIGIFIGLQVDDWNETRKGHVEELNYLERLHSDMIESIEKQEYELDNLNVFSDDLDYLITHLINKTYNNADQDRLKNGWDAIGFTTFPITNLVTLKELQSSGKLSLIRDVKLREAIGGLEVSLDLSTKEMAAASNALASYQPLFAHYALYRSNGKNKTNSDINYSLKIDFKKIADDPELINRLSVIWSWIQYERIYLFRHYEYTVDLQQLLKDTLIIN